MRFVTFLIIELIIVVIATINCFVQAIRHNKHSTLKIDIDSRSQVIHMQKFMETELFKHIMQL